MKHGQLSCAGSTKNWALRLLALFAFSGVVWCQSGSSGAEEMIRQQISGGIIFGFAMKQESGMGDGAAAVISKIIGDKSLSTAEVERILAIIRTSFGRPAALTNVSDREPRATLVLLDHLDASTGDASLRARIVGERQFVLDQVAKASAKDSPECLLANFSAASQEMRLAQVYLTLTDPARETDSTPLRRMGDEVTDFLNTIVGDCKLSSADAQRVLAIVRGAFARPEVIVVTANHEPRRVLRLLQRLDVLTQDQTVRASIAQTRDYVLAQLSNWREN
jgi:hypothetical protein